MTCTVAQPSLTKEMEQNIIESLPNEIDVTIDEENDKDNSKQTLKIKSKKVNSIVLGIHATCKIFQSPSELRSAICALVEMVLDKGEVDKNAEDPILVTLSFESILTEGLYIYENSISIYCYKIFVFLKSFLILFINYEC